MRGHGRLLTAAALTAAGLLTGCSGATTSAKTTATHELPPTASDTTAGSATTPPTSATPTTAPAAPSSPATTTPIPAAARAHTPEGAEAFTRYFIDQVNVAWTTPRAGLISALSLPTCKSCASLEDRVAKLTDAKERYATQPWSVSNVAYQGDTDDRRAVVQMQGAQRAARVVNLDGRQVGQQPQEESDRQFVLRESADGWRVDSIRG
ncbi:DUF6318 family protein [Arsenicicoccus cauae]|uniref:DUF6318 family protein n=1 Tax=Arsenicicoccus cauae TaxID=2663847 RepID=UPI00370DBA36